MQYILQYLQRPSSGDSLWVLTLKRWVIATAGDLPPWSEWRIWDDTIDLVIFFLEVCLNSWLCLDFDFLLHLQMESTGWAAAAKSGRTGNWFCFLLGNKPLLHGAWSELRVSAVSVVNWMFSLPLGICTHHWGSSRALLGYTMLTIMFKSSASPALRKVLRAAVSDKFFKSTSVNVLETFKFWLFLYLDKNLTPSVSRCIVFCAATTLLQMSVQDVWSCYGINEKGQHCPLIKG